MEPPRGSHRDGGASGDSAEGKLAYPDVSDRRVSGAGAKVGRDVWIEKFDRKK
ncbi:MAG: hypothetical protein ACREQF_02745 [Candidatus Binataceae bacterium]